MDVVFPHLSSSVTPVSGLWSKDLLFYPWYEATAGVAFPGRVHRCGSDPGHGAHSHAALGALLRTKGSGAKHYGGAGRLCLSDSRTRTHNRSDAVGLQPHEPHGGQTTGGPVGDGATIVAQDETIQRRKSLSLTGLRADLVTFL